MVQGWLGDPQCRPLASRRSTRDAGCNESPIAWSGGEISRGLHALSLARTEAQGDPGDGTGASSPVAVLRHSSLFPPVTAFDADAIAR